MKKLILMFMLIGFMGQAQAFSFVCVDDGNFVQLNTCDGGNIWVNPDLIKSVERAGCGYRLRFDNNLAPIVKNIDALI